MKRYGAQLLDILELAVAARRRCSEHPSARTLPLSAAARRLWIGFYNHVRDEEVASRGELEPIRGLANKLPEHAARFAAVLAMLGDIDTSEVAPEAMECGIQLAQHYAVEGLRLYGASRVRASCDLHRLCSAGCALATSWWSRSRAFTSAGRGPSGTRRERKS